MHFCQPILYVASALSDVLKDMVMKKPTQEEWSQILEGFWQCFNFPNCVGAVDGKNIWSIKPVGNRSANTLSKKYFSLFYLWWLMQIVVFCISTLGHMEAVLAQVFLGTLHLDRWCMKIDLTFQRTIHCPRWAPAKAVFRWCSDFTQEGVQVSPHQSMQSCEVYIWNSFH